jgi:hypothetical protein
MSGMLREYIEGDKYNGKKYTEDEINQLFIEVKEKYSTKNTKNNKAENDTEKD